MFVLFLLGFYFFCCCYCFFCFSVVCCFVGLAVCLFFLFVCFFVSLVWLFVLYFPVFVKGISRGKQLEYVSFFPWWCFLGASWCVFHADLPVCLL